MDIQHWEQNVKLTWKNGKPVFFMAESKDKNLKCDKCLWNNECLTKTANCLNFEKKG